MLVESAKQAKLDGSPAPTEIPRKEEISRFIGVALFRIVIRMIVAMAPLIIHTKREIRLKRGKYIDPRMAETAIAIYSTLKKVRISIDEARRLLISLLKIDSTKAFQVRLLTTTTKAGKNSLHMYFLFKLSFQYISVK